MSINPTPVKEATDLDKGALVVLTVLLVLLYCSWIYSIYFTEPENEWDGFGVLVAAMYSLPVHLAGVIYYFIRGKRFRGKWKMWLVIYLTLGLFFVTYMF